MRSVAVSAVWPRFIAPWSPERPWAHAPNTAASNADIPCPTSAAITPVSTSPLPPVAMPGTLSQTLQGWGIRPGVTDDQAALLGAEDARSAGSAGQHRIRANDQGMRQ